MNLSTELIEMQEMFESTEELTQQMEMYESGMNEALKAGSSDMAEYYKEKLEELKAMQEAQDKELHFGGYHAGLTANQWREKAADEYVKNGDSMDYKRYKENAVKAAD